MTPIPTPGGGIGEELVEKCLAVRRRTNVLMSDNEVIRQVITLAFAAGRESREREIAMKIRVWFAASPAKHSANKLADEIQKGRAE